MDTRRDFLKKAFMTAAAVTMTPSFCEYCGAMPLDPVVEPISGNVIVDITKSQFKKLANPLGSIQYSLPSPNKGITLLITRKDTETFSVLNAKCTHKGSLINTYIESNNSFTCSSGHGSQYNIDGGVIHGPSIEDLTSYPWTFDATANILTVIGEPLGVERRSELQFALQENFPNPFVDQTAILFSLPSSGIVSLRVSDESGKEIATIFDGHLNAGNHSYHFDGSGLAAGVYFYRLTTASGSLVKQMVLTR